MQLKMPLEYYNKTCTMIIMNMNKSPITFLQEMFKYKRHVTTVNGTEQVICNAELKAADVE